MSQVPLVKNAKKATQNPNKRKLPNSNIFKLQMQESEDKPLFLFGLICRPVCYMWCIVKLQNKTWRVEKNCSTALLSSSKLRIIILDYEIHIKFVLCMHEKLQGESTA